MSKTAIKLTNRSSQDSNLSISGSFSDWNKVDMNYNAETGQWEFDLVLYLLDNSLDAQSKDAEPLLRKDEKIAFKYIKNGKEWFYDDSMPFEDDGLGSFNNYVVVGEDIYASDVELDDRDSNYESNDDLPSNFARLVKSITPEPRLLNELGKKSTSDEAEHAIDNTRTNESTSKDNTAPTTPKSVHEDNSSTNSIEGRLNSMVRKKPLSKPEDLSPGLYQSGREILSASQTDLENDEYEPREPYPSVAVSKVATQFKNSDSITPNPRDPIIEHVEPTPDELYQSLSDIDDENDDTLEIDSDQENAEGDATAITIPPRTGTETPLSKATSTTGLLPHEDDVHRGSSHGFNFISGFSNFWKWIYGIFFVSWFRKFGLFGHRSDSDSSNST